MCSLPSRVDGFSLTSPSQKLKEKKTRKDLSLTDFRLTKGCRGCDSFKCRHGYTYKEINKIIIIIIIIIIVVVVVVIVNIIIIIIIIITMIMSQYQEWFTRSKEILSYQSQN